MKNNDTHQLAKTLRRNQSDAERNLWSKLRNAQMNGVKFRRQQPVGNYIVDFITFDKNLIIEVDGSQHDAPDQKKKDEERTRYLESRDYRVLRFWNNEVLQNLEGVASKILECLGEI